MFILHIDKQKKKKRMNSYINNATLQICFKQITKKHTDSFSSIKPACSNTLRIKIAYQMHSIFPRETAQMVQYENKSYIKKKQKTRFIPKLDVSVYYYIYLHIYIYFLKTFNVRKFL